MDSTGTFWLPPEGSTLAANVDSLFYFIFYAAAVFFFVVTILSIFFAIRYRRRGKRELTPGISHNTRLEITWTVIPSLLFIVVFLWGFNGYLKMRVIPKDAMEVRVTAQKWFWSFDYPEGVNSVGELVVPAGQPVKLVMSSQDVIHSFYVPDFRVKMDVLPNRYTMVWFEAPVPGEHQLFCAEYCGKGHSEMLGKVRVLPEREYEAWLQANASAGKGMTLEEFGKKLYKTKGCITCHSIDGSANTGPTFKNVFGHEVKLNNGQTVKVDENYIRESILTPLAKVVAGYQPVMPPFQGILKPREVDALIAYIKSLKE
ncbi:MAG: cytochrome c oxidase subunit II [Calditrichaeota bacterium]|nr:MAG: cytochrome c oxidase subunit II [Calditrichota bacterium]